jgi:hypothetical protein
LCGRALSCSFIRPYFYEFGKPRCGFYTDFFTSIWPYAGVGFLLKSTRRLDSGFDWFNRKFDIEKKPLQSIGLVAVPWWRWCIGRQ